MICFVFKIILPLGRTFERFEFGLIRDKSENRERDRVHYLPGTQFHSGTCLNFACISLILSFSCRTLAVVVNYVTCCCTAEGIFCHIQAIINVNTI